MRVPKVSGVNGKVLTTKPILMYHSSAPDPDLPVNVPPALLRSHLDLMKQWGWNCCSVRDLVSGDPECDVGLTFDDGYLNNLEVLPLLDEFGAGATFFVLTGAEGQTLPHHWPREVPLMGADGWRSLEKAGFEVAAHGRTHRRLPELSAEAQEAEIAGSIQTLREVLGRDSLGYAYPYGALDADSYRLARRYADYACATRYRRPFGEDRWRLRRINVSGRDHVRRLGLKLGRPFRILCDLGF